jgi:zinc/manganese transport system substrate-binding protein
MRTSRSQGWSRVVAVAAAIAGVTLAAAGCSNGLATASSGSTTIRAVGAESEYANVLNQIGGKYVQVTAILDDPNTDPHTFEASPRVAQAIGTAQLIVQNGVGYDSWMTNIESASVNSQRKVIVVQNVLGLPSSTPNPHLWYDPKTMPAVAKAMATSMSALQPAHAAYFRANLAKFDSSLRPWLTAIAEFKAKYAGTTAATTEPVADYLLAAMGVRNLTPFRFQADIMNGVDPAPQDIALETGFFSKHQVRVFCYNQQVVDALTGSIRQSASNDGIPVVGVYETMPSGYDYQRWMLAEVHAIQRAVTSHTSTQKL